VPPEPENVTNGEAPPWQTGVPLALIVAVGSGFTVTVADVKDDEVQPVVPSVTAT
jgi:hypothetical protein